MLKRITLLAFISFLALSSALILSAQSSIVVPSSSAPTIQSAILQAATGDQITVLPGTYFENVDFLGKSIRLIGLSGSQQTVIDGGMNGPTVRIATGEIDCVLSGFTIRGGGMQLSPTGTGVIEAGAIYTSSLGNSNTAVYPSVEDCVLTGSIVGAFLDAGSKTSFTRCQMIDNNVTGTHPITGLEFGAVGILVSAAGSLGAGVMAFVESCQIIENGYRGVELAGGISMHRCLIQRNGALNTGDIQNRILPTSDGGGILLLSPSLISQANLTSCIISDNFSSTKGGGVAVHRGHLGLGGCLIEGNISADNAGGIYVGQQTPSTGFGGNAALYMKHSVVTNNETLGSVGGVMKGGCLQCPGTVVKIYNSIVWGNSGGQVTSLVLPPILTTYSCVGGGGFGWGNIPHDPQFVDAESDFHLLPTSPCRDAAEILSSVVYPINQYYVSGLFDLDGDPYQLNGAPDMGLDEYSLKGTGEGLSLSVQVGGISVPVATWAPVQLAASDPLLIGWAWPAQVSSPAQGWLFARSIGSGFGEASPIDGFVLNPLQSLLLSTQVSQGTSKPVEFVVPPGLSGQMFQIQAVGVSGLALNGIYMTTDAVDFVLI